MPQLTAQMAVDLARNLSLCAIVVLVYAQILDARRLVRTWRGLRWPGIVLGLILGFAASIAMIAPITLERGLTLDCKLVMVAMAGPFGGPVAAVIATLLAAGFRLWIGGPGTTPYVILIVIAGILGLAFMLVASRRGRTVRPLDFAWLGFGLWTASMGALFIFYRGRSPVLEVAADLAPLLAVFLIGASMLVGWLLLHEQRRHETKDALASSEAKFRSLLDHMLEIVFCRGEKGNGANGYTDAGVSLYGADVARILGPEAAGGRANVDWWYASIHPDDRPAYLEAERARKEEGRKFVLDYRFRHSASGDMRWVRETGCTVRELETGRTYFDSYILDVTREKEAEAKLREALARTDTANRVKAEFLANMSHELRTPLNAIIGFSEMIEREAVGPVGNPVYRDYAKDIRDSGQLLLELITDILDYAKADAGKLVLEEGCVDVRGAVEFCIRLMAPRAEQAGIVLAVSVAPEVHGLRADERRLKQILLNLLSNSIKFTPKGGSVRIDALLDAKGALELAVEDTGIGIDPTDLPSILEAFHQVRNAYNQSQPGSGLGLPLTKRLVELHQGTLMLDSNPGRGTRVTVRLPKNRVILLDEGRVSELPAKVQAQESGLDPVNPPLRPARKR